MDFYDYFFNFAQIIAIIAIILSAGVWLLRKRFNHKKRKRDLN